MFPTTWKGNLQRDIALCITQLPIMMHVSFCNKKWILTDNTWDKRRLQSKWILRKRVSVMLMGNYPYSCFQESSIMGWKSNGDKRNTHTFMSSWVHVAKVFICICMISSVSSVVSITDMIRAFFSKFRVLWKSLERLIFREPD